MPHRPILVSNLFFRADLVLQRVGHRRQGKAVRFVWCDGTLATILPSWAFPTTLYASLSTCDVRARVSFR